MMDGRNLASKMHLSPPPPLRRTRGSLGYFPFYMIGSDSVVLYSLFVVAPIVCVPALSLILYLFCGLVRDVLSS